MQVYLHIYNTYSTNTTLLPCKCMTLKWHRTDIDLCNVMTSHQRHFWRRVPAGCDQDRRVKSCPTLKMKSTVFSKVYFQWKFGHKWLLLFICSAWSYVKELEKIIARTQCFMHRSFFQAKLYGARGGDIAIHKLISSHEIHFVPTQYFLIPSK